MGQTILLPITTRDVEEAVAAAPAIAASANRQGATVLVLETDCLHGVFVDVGSEDEEMELRRYHDAAERVAAALREHGATVETVWECVRTLKRPVDVETVRRHGADAVFLPHPHRRRAVLEGAALRRLRREGIEVLEMPARGWQASVDQPVR